MHHVAIMNKGLGLIENVVSGRKTIESRWYKARFAPWNRVVTGDTIYFKESGGLVTAVASVDKVLQFEDLDKDSFEEIVDNYAGEIDLHDREYSEYYQGKRYCILIFLKEARWLKEQFQIDKTGFGISSAWLCVDDINSIRR